MSNHLLDLSEENKNNLLSEENRSLAHDDQAQKILKELQRINPDLAENFKPKVQALKELKLRMLCYPEAGENVKYVSSYLIISYCWHNEYWTANVKPRQIAPDWEIYDSMVQKVLSLRQSSSEGVWLDKLCIKQSDEKEKGVALGVMDIIYRSARRMLILLEDVQLNESEQMVGNLYAKMYTAMSAHVREKGLGGQEKTEFISSFTLSKSQEIQRQVKASCGYEASRVAGELVMKLLGANWFTRAWCAHESRIVPHLPHNNPLFLSFGPGEQIATFEFRFILFLSYNCSQPVQPKLQGFNSVPLAIYVEEQYSDQDQTTFNHRREQLVRLHPDSSKESSFMDHLYSISKKRCKYQKDLISIALNTAMMPVYFLGSLVSPDDIFLDLCSAYYCIWRCRSTGFEWGEASFAREAWRTRLGFLA